MAVAGGIALDPEGRSLEPVGFMKWGESVFLPYDGSNIPLLVILSLGNESDEEKFDHHPAAIAGDLVSHWCVRPMGRA